MKPKPDPASRVASPAPISLFWRWVISLLLIVHLLAVFIPPFTFATATGPRMESPFARPIMSSLRPYVDLMYLDHGYFFFAPNPGPSHLIRAHLEFADNRQPVDITLPDRSRHWPRLLYHRHFMLSEQFRDSFAPPQLPRELAEDAQRLADWRQARSMYELRRSAIEEHLKSAYGADRVTLTRVEHGLLSPDEFATQRTPLNARDTYYDLPEEAPAMPPPIVGLRP